MYELWFDPDDSNSAYCILEPKTYKGAWLDTEYLPKNPRYLNYGIIFDAVNPRMMGRCKLIESFATADEALGYLKMQVLMEG